MRRKRVLHSRRRRRSKVHLREDDMKYIGVNIVQAEPEQKEGKDGYKFTYEEGYISWCPKEIFEKHNRPCDEMPFSLAIESLRQGKKIARMGWNGKGMFIYLVEGEVTDSFDEQKRKICSHINMKAADDSIVVGWLASQTDMLSDDWNIVDI